MAEKRGEFLIYRIATDRSSGRQIEPWIVVTAARRDEAERLAAQLTGVRQAELAAVGVEFAAPEEVAEARRRTAELERRPR